MKGLTLHIFSRQKLLLPIIFALTVALTAFGIATAQELSDETMPVTEKIYSAPNASGIFRVPGCNRDVLVNVHFISTATTITLSAADPGENASGVNGTFFFVLVPLGCEEEEGLTEYVGATDHNIYESSQRCQVAADNLSTNETETQECFETFWQFKEELLGENETFPLRYTGPFVIPQESVHKICFYSLDNAGNQEELKCQAAVVDDNAPKIHSAEVDHEIVDLETYSGGDGDLYFADPKCTMVIVNASDTHEIDDVQIGIGDVLRSMYANLNPDNARALEKYYEDEMHNMPAADLGADGLYRHWFCPAKHIYHLYSQYYDVVNDSSAVLSYDNFTKFLMEDLVLGEFELPVLVNDTTGKEANASVNITIADLTVPLELGWNLRSTPIKLEGAKFWATDSIDAVLTWDSVSQSWELVTDNSITPMTALYMHSKARTQIGYIFERDLTSPPGRVLHEGWNLVGMALPLSDYWTTPYYCDNPFDEDSYDEDGEYGDYYAGYCYLTYLSTEDKNTREAFLPVIYDAEGKRALKVVISLQQSLTYGNEWASWYFYQYPNEYVPRITSGGADPTNSGFSMINFGGYWAFMQNDAFLPGFTTTPLPLYPD